MLITLKDGTQKEGFYSIKPAKYAISAFKIKGYKNKERYGLKDIKRVVVLKDGASYQFETVNTKKYTDSKTTKLKFGQVVYRGEKITLYETVETIYSGSAGGGFMVQSSTNYQNSYAKKKNDDYAYNVGYIYGVAQKGIKKRLRAYFAECEKLVAKVDNDEIDKKNIKDIILFYENNCATN